MEYCLCCNGLEKISDLIECYICNEDVCVGCAMEDGELAVLCSSCFMVSRNNLAVRDNRMSMCCKQRAKTAIR